MNKIKELEQAKAQLESVDIYCVIQNDSLYIDIDGLQLELSEFEIKFRAELYHLTKT